MKSPTSAPVLFFATEASLEIYINPSPVTPVVMEKVQSRPEPVESFE
jgi:hypothetical protein